MKYFSLYLSAAFTASLLTTQVLADLTILSGEEFDNSGGYANSGTVTNLGTFNNASFLVNEFDSLFLNLNTVTSTGSIQHHGTLVNEASFENQSDFHNDGVLINSTNGIFMNTWSGQIENGHTILNSGVFNNEGHINNFNSAKIINTGIFNAGDAAFFSSGEMSFRDNSLFDNIGTLNVNQFIRFNGFSQLSNIEVLNNNNNLSFNDSTKLLNAGEINNKGFISISHSSEFNNDNVINNDGRISMEGSGDFENNGVVNNGIINDSFGPMQASIEGFSHNRFINHGEVNNHGTISGFGLYENKGIITNSNRIAVASNTDFNNESGAVINNGKNGPDNFSGEIVMDSFSRLNNAGEINNASVSGIKMNHLAEITNTGVINNDGSIEGSGIIVNNGDINNNQSGFITSETISGNGTLKNHGFIDSASISVDGGGELSGSGRIKTSRFYANTFVDGLVVSEGAKISPDGIDVDFDGNPIIADETAVMQIEGDVLLEGLFDVDIDVSKVARDFFDDFQDFDQLDISGNLFLGTDSIIDISFLSPAFGSGPIDLIFADAIYGEFSNNGFFYDGQHYVWEIIDGGFKDILRLDVAAVPLPAGLWLFLSGGVLLSGFARKKQVII